MAQVADVSAGDPIVSDSEFEEQLPPLDPELDKPLEPIENYAPPPSPLAAPPIPEAEVIPDVVVPEDPALAEPLPPLQTFDVTPDAAAAVAEVEEDAPIVRYDLQLEGFADIGLAGRFRDLSALEEGDGEAANAAMITARAREDEELAVRLMRSEGYYDGTAVAVVEQPPEGTERLLVTITAAPGERYRFDEIAVTGPATRPPDLAREALPLEAGEPIVAAEVEAAEANVSVSLPQRGYPFVEIGRRDILLDPATQFGDYTLPVDPGPRALFGGFATEGDLAFDAGHVGVLARFERGELYDSRKVDDLREAMVATGLFSSVSAEPVRTGIEGPGESEYVNILVRQDAGPPRSITASAGYGTGEGLRAEVAWEHRNLFPPEGALRIGAVGGTQEQSLRLQFRRSNAGKRDRSLLLTAEAARRDYEAYSAYTATLAARMSRESTPIWQKRWTWALGAELIATNESRFDPVTQMRDRATYFIGALPGQLGYDRSDNLLNPTKGFRLLGRLSPELSLHDGTRPYVRSQIDASAYYPIGDSIVIAGRARFASIMGIGRDDLAPSRRLYAGGGGSVRGFGYQELGPRDINNDPLGGRSLNEFALEARYRFGDYGIVPFIDAGQVYEGEVPELSDIRLGVGIGGRLYTNFGPLRIDVATPLKRREGESRIALYISIGQAF
jgi:translocation and assembly module TamA